MGRDETNKFSSCIMVQFSYVASGPRPSFESFSGETDPLLDPHADPKPYSPP